MDFLLQRVDFLPLGVLGTFAFGCLYLVSEGADVAAHLLERIVQRQGAWHQLLIHFAIDFFKLRRYCILRGLNVALQLLVLGGCLDLRLETRLPRLHSAQILRVHLGKPALIRLPRADAVDLVVERPAER